MSYIYPLEKNNHTHYKVYFVYSSKKIYLGTYPSYETAQNVLKEAKSITKQSVGNLDYHCIYITYHKYICLCNLRDHHVYFKNPIYTYDTYFCYHLTPDIILIFDLKDLFFFSTYKIYKRAGYLYTQDNITQQSILSRFGIPAYSILDVDYKFKNNCIYDFRRENIVLINAYKGVTRKKKNDQWIYVSKIFIHHTIIIGHYHSELEAAIAYNKAIDALIASGIQKDYIKNTFPYLTLTEYQEIYDRLSISPCIKTPSKHKRIVSTKQYRGICKDKSGFRAIIGYKGKQIYLGIYPTQKRAAQAYNMASFYLYGNNGYINDVQPLIYHPDTDKIANKLSKYHVKRANVASPT